jgi:hypothetical protein
MYRAVSAETNAAITALNSAAAKVASFGVKIPKAVPTMRMILLPSLRRANQLDRDFNFAYFEQTLADTALKNLFYLQRAGWPIQAFRWLEWESNSGRGGWTTLSSPQSGVPHPSALFAEGWEDQSIALRFLKSRRPQICPPTNEGTFPVPNETRLSFSDTICKQNWVFVEFTGLFPAQANTP